ncbi:acyl-CoA dehydrogenase family protein [Nocardioides sp. SOB44]|uniref:Acyl-CoA dehydrogenase family protein n=1 Tax=Nocardioides cremeus TaxID=3058044 RepID=A0ABT8TN54_9ACTN|nr:acyl-CoA dehydrogenase family protein [Nocardioides cremeus]MDO3395395.1 acyl-CoA dehydrogenase family protein [Nocardioides cremeus]
MTTTAIAGAEELEDLRLSVRSLLADKSDESRVREVMESDLGYDASVWRQLADQVGVQSLAVPEHHGGAGFGQVELGVALRELGRALVPGPFFSSVVLGAGALLAAQDESAMAAHLPGIAAGTTLATLAVIETDGQWRTHGFTTRAREDAEASWTLDGEKSLVLDAVGADLYVVAADTPHGPGLFLVESGAAGLEVTGLRALDPTRRVGRLTLTGTPAAALGRPGNGTAALEHLLDRATAALAAEQVGAARACLEMSVAYARQRVQFGRPIGSFQAVKHMCADMFTRLEVAEAAATEAARAVDGLPDAPPAGEAAAVAHAVCSEAFMFIAQQTIQVHGGIGFTWEHPAHLYFRRAKVSQLMFGGPAVYYERLLERWGV